METSEDLAQWRGWIGRSEQRSDLVSAAPLAALSATLDRDDGEPLPGGDVPPLLHGPLFTPQTLARDIGPDGHIHAFSVCGKPDGERRFALWARDHEGFLAMQAQAELV